MLEIDTVYTLADTQHTYSSHRRRRSTGGGESEEEDEVPPNAGILSQMDLSPDV